VDEADPVLTRVPALSAALAHARGRWRERGGLLVVPTREAAAQALLDEAAELGAVLDREAVTFAALRGRVAKAAGIPEPEQPSRIELRLALREVLERVDLSAFGESAGSPGFLSGIERAVGELRAARVPPERAESAAATPVARAVAAVHAAAWDAVPHPSDALWAVADAAAGLSSFPPVVVAGFDDLVPGQWALLRALGRAARVEVVLPFDPRRRAFEARRGRQEAWARAATTTTADHPAEGPGALARRLFEDGPPLGVPPDLRLVGAAGTRGMLRAALDEVLDAAASGVPLGRIALVVPRLADVRDDLERLLGDWGVAARHATRVRVLEAPLALALVHLLRLGEIEGEDPGALDHLLGWLRTPYSGADPAEVDRFEVDARRASLARRGELIARWDGHAIAPARRLVAAARQGPRAQIAALLEVGWEALRRAARVDAPPTPADLHDRDALSALAGLGRAVSGDGDGDGPGDLDDPPERPRGPVPPGALGDLVSDLTFVSRRGSAGGIDVHDMASLRGHRYDVVVVAGLDGDGYPGRPASDPFLSGLRAGLGDLLPPRAPGTSESRLRVTHAVDAARRGLRLVRRAVDDDGREVAPSPYWIEICRVAGLPWDRLDRRTGARGEVADAPDAARTEREALRALAADAGVAPGPLAKAAARRVRPVGGLGPDAFADRTRFRVTELEAFLRCPYGWFRDNHLQPQEIAEPLDVRFEGSLGHAILQSVYERMRDERVGPCGPQTLDRYREALEEVVAQTAASPPPPGAGAAYRALLERLRRHLSAMLGREAALGSALVPTVFERRLEDDLLVADVAPGVVVSGQLDRLDVSESGGHALVVDYKRSGARFGASSDDVTQRLQLPLYGRMAHDVLGGVEPIGGLYMGMLSAGIDGAVRDDVPGAPAVSGRRLVSAERWDEITEDAVEAVRDAVVRIRAGELAPPSTGGCSFWCRCEDLWR
jgi:RecB family exonuclease